MLKIQKLSLLSLAVSAVISTNVFAAEQKLSDDYSYVVGYATAEQFVKGVTKERADVIKFDNKRILEGFQDALNDKNTLTEKEINDSLLAMATKVAETRQAKATEEFMKKDGAKKTTSGLMYRIEKAGTGEAIKASDSVKVHYTGKLANGEVFDSSLNRGEPIEFKLNQVIPGWTEGLQLIKKGGKIELLIPANLAYGERGAGPIPPNSILHFDVEVLDVNPETNKK